MKQSFRIPLVAFHLGAVVEHETLRLPIDFGLIHWRPECNRIQPSSDEQALWSPLPKPVFHLVPMSSLVCPGHQGFATDGQPIPFYMLHQLPSPSRAKPKVSD